MDSILSLVKTLACDSAGGVMVREVRMGLGYTAVSLEDGRTGLAYTFRHHTGAGCAVPSGRLPLAGQSVWELSSLLQESGPVPRAVGLATCNAVLNTPDVNAAPGDVLKDLHIGPEDRVAMIGFFAPLLKQLQKKAAEVLVFEEEQRWPDSHPASRAAPMLPSCQVALITATSLLNGTAQALMEAASRCRAVALLGPSTPLVPDLLHTTPLSLLSGMLVHDPAGVLRTVSEGGGTREFNIYTQKVNLSLERVI